MIRVACRTHWKYAAAALVLPNCGGGRRSQCAEDGSTQRLVIAGAVAGACGLAWWLKSKQPSSNAAHCTITQSKQPANLEPHTSAELEFFLGKCFDVWDADNNGFLEGDEILALGVAVFATLNLPMEKYIKIHEKEKGSPCSEDERLEMERLVYIDMVSRMFDVNKDNRVSREEFRNGCMMVFWRTTDADKVIDKLKHMSVEKKGPLLFVPGAHPLMVKTAREAAQALAEFHHINMELKARP